MNATSTIELLRGRQIDLRFDGVDLILRGKVGNELSTVLRNEIRSHKPELLRALAPPVFLDLETVSAVDIKLGGRKYAQDDSTRILSCVALIDRRLVVWVPVATLVDGFDFETLQASLADGLPPGLELQIEPGENLPEIIERVANAGRTFAAHNADGFDALVWRAKNLPPPDQWLDTIHLARAAGYPASLDKLAATLLREEKLSAGNNLVKRLNREARQEREFTLLPLELTELIQYNISDVLLLAEIFPFLGASSEPDVIEADRIINERGIAFDQGLAERLIAFDQQRRQRVIERLEQITQGLITRRDLNRVQFLRGWLEQRGIMLSNLRRETVEEILHSGVPITDEARAVLEARLSESRNSTNKLGTALELSSKDGRIRDSLVFHRGHPGRWAGRGVQPQNLPKSHPAIRDLSGVVNAASDFDRFERALPEGVSIEDGIAALIRPCFVAPQGHVLCIADYASVEARGLALLAGEESLLQGFRKGEDVYLQFAAQIFGREITRENTRERNIGKIAVLGCGYQMSAARFQQHADSYGIDLSAADVTAEQIVEGYRSAFPHIAGFPAFDEERSWREGGLWRDVEQAARSVINHSGPLTVGRCRFAFHNSTLMITLLSGRTIHYRNARVEWRVAPWGDWAEQLVYDAPRGNSESTYGGKLVENIVQGYCRDLLADALVKCENSGLPVVLHVHDEIVIEVPEQAGENSLNQLLEIMSTPPAWAPDFPLAVEGFVADRYYKSPVDGSSPRIYRNGSPV